MNNLNELAKEYKANKDQKVMEQIFELLLPILNKKAEYVYYQQKFKIKGKYINLKQSGLIELDDVRQELNLTVLELLKDYDGIRPFTNFFYSVLWHWGNQLINSSFLNQLNTFTESALITEENSCPLDIKYNNPEQRKENILEELTEDENAVVMLLFENPHLTQEEIASKFGVTRQRISQIIIEIRKKINLR